MKLTNFFYPIAKISVFLALAAPVMAQNTAPKPDQKLDAKPAAELMPFEKEIIAFEEADKKSPPKTEGALFVGSSSFRLWSTMAKDLPELPVINRGFGGSQLYDSVRYADRIVIPYKPKMVVMYAGTNDIAAGKSPAKVCTDFQTFVDKVHAALPTTRIVYVSCNPSVSRWKLEDKMLETNKLIEKYIHEKTSPTLKLNYIDTHAALLGPDGQPQPSILRADGLHLNTEGYKKWAELLRPQLVALWQH